MLGILPFIFPVLGSVICHVTQAPSFWEKAREWVATGAVYVLFLLSLQFLIILFFLHYLLNLMNFLYYRNMESLWQYSLWRHYISVNKSIESTLVSSLLSKKWVSADISGIIDSTSVLKQNTYFSCMSKEHRGQSTFRFLNSVANSVHISSYIAQLKYVDWPASNLWSYCK